MPPDATNVRPSSSLLPRNPLIFAPHRMLSLMLLGNGFGFWKTMPIRRRTSTGSTLRIVEIDSVVKDASFDSGATEPDHSSG